MIEFEQLIFIFFAIIIFCYWVNYRIKEIIKEITKGQIEAMNILFSNLKADLINIVNKDASRKD